MSVISDKEQAARTQAAKEWPRPEQVACRCGGTAQQIEKGSASYRCLKCSTQTIAWTGFDDPAWF